MKTRAYAGREPRLRLEEYFNGKTKAWGVFQDRFGTLRRQFEVEIEGTWDGQTLTMVEDFRYDDGETEQRIWRIQPVGAHGYQGSAGGVIGQAEGTAHGNVMTWRYLFGLPVGKQVWTVRFEDWFFLMGDGVLINRATVRKLGLRLGEATIAFRRLA